MRPAMALRDEHLAVLHKRARELDVPSYRMLSRDELIEAIEDRGGAAETEGDESAGREEAVESGLERRRGEAATPSKEVAAPAAAAEVEAPPNEAGGGEEAASEEVTGVLDRMQIGRAHV